MSEVGRIADQLKKSFNGPAWHGPAVKELLADVKAEHAAARPLQGRHTIWEIILHVAVWEDVVRRRLQGETIKGLTPMEDWPPVRDASEAAWKKAVSDLEGVNGRLVEAVSRFGDSRLGEAVPGTSYSFYTMLHGIIQHDLYHAGQIAILKKK